MPQVKQLVPIVTKQCRTFGSGPFTARHFPSSGGKSLLFYSWYEVIVVLDATTKGPSPLVGESKLSRESKVSCSENNASYIQIINHSF
jgi:hypothetical protein